MKASSRYILIVEDDDEKFDDVIEVVQGHLCRLGLPIERATTARDGERQIKFCSPTLMVLDMSMGITKGASVPLRAGFASLGGLDIIDRMHFTKRSCPTVIVTGFDLFKAKAHQSTDYEMIGLAEIAALSKQRIGDDFLGCVRYENEGWADELRAILDVWVSKCEL